MSILNDNAQSDPSTLSLTLKFFMWEACHFDARSLFKILFIYYSSFIKVDTK